jgi:isocitrate dehydrogenase
LGTTEFAQAVIERLGQAPQQLKPVKYAANSKLNLPKYVRKSPAPKELQGVDLFVHWTGTDPNTLADHVSKWSDGEVKLSMITNRGIKVWPDGFKETYCTDHWRCRFKATDKVISQHKIIQLLQTASNSGLEVIKTENLYAFNGVSAFSLGQGQ